MKSFDYCAGLLLIKQISTVDIWQHLEGQGKRIGTYDNAQY